MRIFGILVLVCGVAVMVGGFAFPVAVIPDTDAIHRAAYAAIRGMTEDEARPILEQAFAPVPALANTNKMAIRGMLNTSGGAVAIIGAVFAAAGSIRRPDLGRRDPTSAGMSTP